MEFHNEFQRGLVGCSSDGPRLRSGLDGDKNDNTRNPETVIRLAESRRPFSRTHRSLEDYRICYTAIEESNLEILPSEFCQQRNWFQLYKRRKLEEEWNSQWKNLFNISGRTRRSTSTPKEEMFCRMPCQRLPVWITEKRLLQILGHPPGRYFIKENIFFGGTSRTVGP